MATALVPFFVASFAAVVAAPAIHARPADGKALYAEHCASCHGKDGGGDGLLAKELKYKPRAFKEGKFAFGNTPDAMAKTVLSGIPGEEVARMPAFKSVLSEEEVAAVVDYVRTLMPAQPELTPADMKMEVTDCAKIARGILAPLHDGERPLARGLLVGLPSGFSFEYATESFHLVAVRRGEFLTRSDWEGRGGKPLTPLGTALWIAPAPETWIPFAVAAPPPEGEHAQFGFTVARLRRTTALGPDVELEYDLVDARGKGRARVIERPRAIAVTGGGGLVQEFELHALGPPVSVLCSLAVKSDPTLALPAAPELAAVIAAGTPPLVRHSSEQRYVAAASGFWIVRPPDGGYACVKVEAPGSAIVSNFNGETHDCVDVQVVVADAPVTVRRTTIFRTIVTTALLEAMARELGAKR